jgi:alpha/beta hydrolase fold
MRAVFEHLGDATAEPRGVDYIEVDAASIAAMWAVPKNCAEDRVLLCAHGGGYISGSMYSHRKMYAHYAKKIGCRALIVNYRLAPENRHPGPVNEMAKAYRWLLDQGITPNHLAIAGDSAGGSLAITTMNGKYCVRNRSLESVGKSIKVRHASCCARGGDLSPLLGFYFPLLSLVFPCGLLSSSLSP